MGGFLYCISITTRSENNTKNCIHNNNTQNAVEIRDVGLSVKKKCCGFNEVPCSLVNVLLIFVMDRLIAFIKISFIERSLLCIL